MIGDRGARQPVGTIVLGLALSALTGGPARAEDPASALSEAFRKSAARVRPLLVSIRPAEGFVLPPPILGARPAPGFPPEIPAAPLIGPAPSFTGLIVDPDKGYILTAEGPTEGLSRFAVTFPDGRERSTAEIRRDPRSGLALLAADMRDLPHPRPTWGDPSRLEPGDWLIAVGRFGPGDPSMSAGILGARRRIAGFESLESDALGRLGGRGILVNLQGEVVGIGQPIRRRPEVPEGLGLAVPSDRARRVADDLGRFGAVRRGQLGVVVEPAGPSAEGRALRVLSVRPDSPAADARIEPGDLILSVDGREVAGVAALQEAVESADLGREMTLTIDRRGRRMEIKARIRALDVPSTPPRPARSGEGALPTPGSSRDTPDRPTP